MKAETQTKFFKTYPALFHQKKWPMTQTCMCWGIEVGEGWTEILEKLCAQLTKICKKKKINVEFTSVKEKFGGLRVYINKYDKEIDKAIEKACQKSYKTCETCGTTKDVSQNKKGYIVTLCKNCHKGRKL